jgi:S1-C subfamily serine protease
MPPVTLRIAAALLLALACLTSSACRREVARMDGVQKMAYQVKPAVVRVTAVSTASFNYEPAAIREIETIIRAREPIIAARDLPARSTKVETGAGGSGSGFIIHPSGVIMTSYHVVAPMMDRAALEKELRRNGAIAALMRHFPIDVLRRLYRDEQLGALVERVAAAGRLSDLVIRNEIELSNGEKAAFHLIDHSPGFAERGADIALLRIASVRPLPTVRLGDSDTIHLQESIWVAGYPGVASSTDDVIGGWLSQDSDLEATFNPGTITAIKRNVAHTPVFQTDVALYRGNSGGPAVNRAGEVIGIATWGHTSAEQIKFLVPINGAGELLARQKIAATGEGEFNTLYRQALEDASQGEWLDAKTALVRANALFPNSPDLIRFMRDADVATGAMTVWERNPLLTRFAATGVLLLTIVLLAVFFNRSRRFAPPPPPGREVFVAPSLRAPNEQPQPLGEASLLGRFTILNGERAGERLGLGGSGIRIGRESAICEIVLENPKVSRLHAEVVSVDGRVMLIDRNSSNGTYVNDQKIDRTYLRDGDIIYFGGRNAIAVAFHA